jgi:uncharacterized protein YbjQ (UPF0145 family)
MFLEELNLRIADVVMLIGFVIAGVGAYWKVMAELKSLKDGHTKLTTRNEAADRETAVLRDTIHQHALTVVAVSTKLDGIKEMLDKVYNKLESK